MTSTNSSTPAEHTSVMVVPVSPLLRELILHFSHVALGEGASVTDAARRSGYKEPSSFIAAFRSAFGTTPSRYFSTATS